MPVVGGLYDIASLILERDPFSGEPLTDVEKGLILAGLLLGGLGFADELLEGGATAARLRHLDEFTAGDRALLRGDDLRRVLAGLDEDALARRLGHLDEATAFRLSHLDEFTAGDRALLQGDELRHVLGGFDDGGSALARRLDATALHHAAVPYDPYFVSRQLGFTDRLTGALEENLRSGRGRHILIDLKKLDSGSVRLKPAAQLFDGELPYKGSQLKHLKSDELGFVRDPDTGEILAISDPDIMAIVEDGRILSNARTLEEVDALNQSWVRRGSPVLETHYPFQHSGRATYYEVPGAVPSISMDLPEHVADFSLDAQGHLRVELVTASEGIPGKERYLDYIEKIAYNETLSAFPWYTRSERSLVVRNPISIHAASQMAARGGITSAMVNTAIEKGTRFLDRKEGTIAHVLQGGFSSGKTLYVATNPFTGKVTTVIRRSKFNPNTVLPDGTLRWVPFQ